MLHKIQPAGRRQTPLVECFTELKFTVVLKDSGARKQNFCGFFKNSVLDLNLALPLTSGVTLSKAFYFLCPQFPYL